MPNIIFNNFTITLNKNRTYTQLPFFKDKKKQMQQLFNINISTIFNLILNYINIQLRLSNSHQISSLYYLQIFKLMIYVLFQVLFHISILKASSNQKSNRLMLEAFHYVKSYILDIFKIKKSWINNQSIVIFKDYWQINLILMRIQSLIIKKHLMMLSLKLECNKHYFQLKKLWHLKLNQTFLFNYSFKRLFNLIFFLKIIQTINQNFPYLIKLQHQIILCQMSVNQVYPKNKALLEQAQIFQSPHFNKINIKS
ncbi:unnamed protein product [Paramecium sonneborni]|uniref:Transmembrane protein n=1 Tax=Paramecium sonneborni TaxID=65129 RepID=A0A8S1RAA0_9CILI|nr:unnamed protein product [Paramecium sonneborni]